MRRKTKMATLINVGNFRGHLFGMSPDVPTVKFGMLNSDFKLNFELE